MELNVGTWDIIDDINDALIHMGYEPKKVLEKHLIYDEDDLIDFALNHLYANLYDVFVDGLEDDIDN